jgi:hypothetical protein
MPEDTSGENVPGTREDGRQSYCGSGGEAEGGSGRVRAAST